MKVNELIKALADWSPDTEVVVELPLGRFELHRIKSVDETADFDTVVIEALEAST